MRKLVLIMLVMSLFVIGNAFADNIDTTTDFWHGHSIYVDSGRPAVILGGIVEYKVTDNWSAWYDTECDVNNNYEWTNKLKAKYTFGN